MDSSRSCSVSEELFVLDCVCQESFINEWEFIYKLIYGMFYEHPYKDTLTEFKLQNCKKVDVTIH